MFSQVCVCPREGVKHNLSLSFPGRKGGGERWIPWAGETPPSPTPGSGSGGRGHYCLVMLMWWCLTKWNHCNFLKSYATWKQKSLQPRVHYLSKDVHIMDTTITADGAFNVCFNGAAMPPPLIDWIMLIYVQQRCDKDLLIDSLSGTDRKFTWHTQIRVLGVGVGQEGDGGGRGPWINRPIIGINME